MKAEKRKTNTLKMSELVQPFLLEWKHFDHVQLKPSKMYCIKHSRMNLTLNLKLLPKNILIKMLKNWKMLTLVEVIKHWSAWGPSLMTAMTLVLLIFPHMLVTLPWNLPNASQITLLTLAAPSPLSLLDSCPAPKWSTGSGFCRFSLVDLVWYIWFGKLGSVAS